MLSDGHRCTPGQWETTQLMYMHNADGTMPPAQGRWRQSCGLAAGLAGLALAAAACRAQPAGVALPRKGTAPARQAGATRPPPPPPPAGPRAFQGYLPG